jgi:CO/xanthine dehydrogenase Mo-binding subunit
MKPLGESVVRVDGVEKVTGSAIYSVDDGFPNALFGAVVRSDRAHARIVGVNADEALKDPSVRHVLTFADFKNLDAYYGHWHQDHPILAPGVVRYWGEPLAVVIAETRADAERAAKEVYVDYEELVPVMTPEEAMRPGAPLVHPNAPAEGTPMGPAFAGDPATNEGFRSDLEWGDVDSAMAGAHEVVVTTSRMPPIYPFAMEPFCAHARFLGQSLEVISPGQHPFQAQRDLARVFGLPLSSVRVRSPYIGGGYGSKAYTKIEPLVAACSWAMDGLPVTLAFDVEESIYTSITDAATVVVTTGFAEDGKILARDFDILLSTGTYTENSPQILKRCTTRCVGPYRIPAFRAHGTAIHTNTAPADSFRGLGAYHTNIAGEANLDQAAERLGLTPFEIRQRNFLRPGEEIIPGFRPLDGDVAENLKLLQRSLVAREDTSTTRFGVGIACAAADAGALPVSTAIVRMLHDGSVVVLTGSSEMGQGSRTVLSQIAAAELDVSLDMVSMVQADTHTTAYEWSTGASRTTVIVGLSIQRACRDIVHKLLSMAADSWGGTSAEWSWHDGVAVCDDGTTRTAEQIMTAWFGAGRGEVVGVGQTRQKDDLDPLPVFWELGMIGVEVSVDVETGVVSVDKFVTVADIGKAINPNNVKGQEFGAAMQGMGAALFEQLVYDGPQIVNSNLVEYRVPRVGDIPAEVQSITVERGDGPGPYGAKGVGEGALTPFASAVTAAIADATGVWFDSIPITPEMVWQALRNQEPAVTT